MLNKITFLLPTCEPEEMFKWLLPTINILQPSKDFINFAICFQPPYSQKQINTVISELNKYNFNYKYIYKDYKIKVPFTPLLQMRNDCAMLYPDSLVYGLLDDDMSFVDIEVNDNLNLVLNSFINNSNLGVIAFKSEAFMERPDNNFATDNGLFYRGGISYGFEGLMPQNLYQFPNVNKLILNYENENLLELFGGYQDKFCALIHILNGEDAALKLVTSIHHTGNRKIRGAVGHKWLSAQELEGSISQFIVKYICRGFLLTTSAKLVNKSLAVELYKNYNKNYKYIKITRDKTNNIIFHYKELEKEGD